MTTSPLLTLALRHLVKLQAVGVVCRHCPDNRACLARRSPGDLQADLVHWIYGNRERLCQAIEKENENEESKMLTFVTDIQSPGEPDLLTPRRFFGLTVTTLEGTLITSYPPPRTGWTEADLRAVSERLTGSLGMGANAFLGGTWIGSTEV